MKIVIYYLLFLLNAMVFGQKANQANEKSCLGDIKDASIMYPLSKAGTLMNSPEIKIDQYVHKNKQTVGYRWYSGRLKKMIIDDKEKEIAANDIVIVFFQNLDELPVLKRRLQFNRKSQSAVLYSQYFRAYHDPSLLVESKNTQQTRFENYSEIENLGDEAYSLIKATNGDRISILSILHKNVVLKIEADISNDDKMDLSTATKVAEYILGLCK